MTKMIIYRYRTKTMTMTMTMKNSLASFQGIDTYDKCLQQSYDAATTMTNV